MEEMLNAQESETITPKHHESGDQLTPPSSPPEMNTPPHHTENEEGSPEKQDSEDENSPEDCECCQLLREHCTPIVIHSKPNRSGVRSLCMFKLESSSKNIPSSSKNEQSPPLKDDPPVKEVKRLLDRFEESRLWDLIGLNAKMYKKLPAELKKITPARVVFRKCAYRLHNTRHFQVPLVKKANGVTKENVLKQTYEDDRKLQKKNQAFECVYPDCPHSFQDPQDMRIHYMFNHEFVKVFCCGNRFDHYDPFVEHYMVKPIRKEHSPWTAQECWGCVKRFSDPQVFHKHLEKCDFTINQYPCPDPLCKIRFNDLTKTVEHFYAWHDPAAAIVWRDTTYPNLASIREDLIIMDQAHLVFTYPMKSVYKCQLCQIDFVTEQYYYEHVINHVNTPHFWLVPTILFCVGCRQRNCRFQRIKLLELLPKVIAAARAITVEDCTKNPVFLLWRLYLSKEFIETMEMALMKLVAEHQRLEEEERFLDLTGHPECEDKRLAYILNSLYFLYTVPYKSDKQIIQEKGFVFPKIVLSDDETQ
ncbi:unnamed protein product [Caenorhabditis brenneri]